MKILGTLINIVFVLVMVTEASFSATDTIEDLRGLGFTSSTTLTFTQTVVNSLLDPAFDSALGEDDVVKNVKYLLRGTVIEALSLTYVPAAGGDQRATFLQALNTALTRDNGAIVINISSLEYNANLAPTAMQISAAAQLLSARIPSLNTVPAAAMAARPDIIYLAGHFFG